METNRLVQFKVLVELRHMRKSAEALRMSHAGLSKSIHALESELGIQLLRQNGRNIEVTEDGIRLYQNIPQVMQAIEKLKNSAEKSKVHEKRISIGTFEVFSTHTLSKLVKDHLESNFHVQVHELLPGHLERAIVGGSVDLGITYLPIPTQGIEFYKLCSISMGIYVCSPELKKLGLSDLPFATPLTPIEGNPTGVRGLDGWPEHLVPRRVAFEVDMMETAIRLVSQGACAAFLPDFVARLVNEQANVKYQLQKYEVRNPHLHIVRDVYLLRRPGRVENALEKKISKGLRLICKGS